MGGFEAVQAVGLADQGARLGQQTGAFHHLRLRMLLSVQLQEVQAREVGRARVGSARHQKQIQVQPRVAVLRGHKLQSTKVEKKEKGTTRV